MSTLSIVRSSPFRFPLLAVAIALVALVALALGMLAARWHSTAERAAAVPRVAPVSLPPPPSPAPSTLLDQVHRAASVVAPPAAPATHPAFVKGPATLDEFHAFAEQSPSWRGFVAKFQAAGCPLRPDQQRRGLDATVSAAVEIAAALRGDGAVLMARQRRQLDADLAAKHLAFVRGAPPAPPPIRDELITPRVLPEQTDVILTLFETMLDPPQIEVLGGLDEGPNSIAMDLSSAVPFSTPVQP